MIHTTPNGQFVQDTCGLWHYAYKNRGRIDRAIEDALTSRPAGAAWFWFNGTPAPMVAGDSRERLFRRWCDWRSAYQETPSRLLTIMQGFAESGDE